MNHTQQSANRRVAMIAAGVVAVMLGVVAYAPTLYDLFCRVTGFAGTPQQAEAAPDPAMIRDIPINVRFDASIASGMAWKFRAPQAMTVRPGEQRIAYYTAHNPTDAPVAGTATFNVAPNRAGAFFTKIECFCFTEQLLQPGESVEMPVVFFIDPEMVDDPTTDDLREITLSYTFFETELEQEALAQAASTDAQRRVN